MHRWHPDYPAHVPEPGCFPWVRTRATRLQKEGSNHPATWADPYLRSSYQRLRLVATIRRNKYSCILVCDYSDDRLACCHTRNFRRPTPDGHPMPTGTRIIPLDVLFNCASPCLMFLRFAVRCAAYAAWATPGLAQTDTCAKLTCWYQVRVSSGTRNTSLSADMHMGLTL